MAHPAPRDPAPTGFAGGLTQAKSLAASLPELLVEARRVALTVAAGWHGRRQAGTGETFWQFRPFTAGESSTRVDWRRSARDEQLYVREREWDAAHTLWLWADLSASMRYRSKLSAVTKRDRAVVLMLAIGDLLARSGERIGLPGYLKPTAHRQATERVAATLPLIPETTGFPQPQPIRRFSDVIVFGDFLDPFEDVAAQLQQIAASGARGHLVQVLDPSEETFPYLGRTEFHDPESGDRLTTGRAESWRDAYRAELSAHRDALRDLTRRIGWSFLVHHTDRPAAEPLLALHARLNGAGNAGGVRIADAGGRP